MSKRGFRRYLEMEHGPEHAKRYKIIRMYANPGHPSRTIRRGLTLAQAQAHCEDPETSSTTARSSAAKARTRRLGAWFDGYDLEFTPRQRRRQWRRGPR